LRKLRVEFRLGSVKPAHDQTTARANASSSGWMAPRFNFSAA
jgi:hypothetical protein